MVALVRDISPALADCELTFQDRQPIDLRLAEAQHAAYREALRRAGAQVAFIAPTPEYPDGVFVEDTAVVLDEIAVITRPGAESRRGEITTVVTAVAPHRPLSFIRAPATLDGGDVMRAGRDLFVGLTARSNREGCQQLAEIASRFGYRVRGVRVTGCLHLKTAVTAIDTTTLMINPAFVSRSMFPGYRLIDVPQDEPSGADVLCVNGVVLVAASAPRTRDIIARAGHRAELVNVSEFEKAEAGVTCLSLLV